MLYYVPMGDLTDDFSNVSDDESTGEEDDPACPIIRVSK